MNAPRPETEVRAARLVAARRTMRRMALFSLMVAIAAVVLVAKGSEHPSIHILLATAIGVGGTVLMGTALMTLTFYSNASGHDRDAHTTPTSESDPE